MYQLNNESVLNELSKSENSRAINEQDFSISLSQILKDMKNTDIKDGKALSDVPPLILFIGKLSFGNGS